MQSDLERLDHWYCINKLKLNLSKCHVIHFSKKRSVEVCGYSLNGVVLTRVEFTSDLGVEFCTDLSFKRHIRNVTNRATKSLGFVLRASKYFRNVSTLKLLYCSLVRPHLEYAAIVWSPYQVKYYKLLEKIQHRFLRRVSYFMGCPMLY